MDKFSQYEVKDEPINEDHFSQYQVNDKEEDPGAYLDKLPSAPGFFQKLPRNILIGLAKMGHGLINNHHDTIKALENRGQEFDKLIPENIRKLVPQSKFRLSEHIPMQQDYDFASMLGQTGEGTLMDNIIQKATQYFPEILGGRALLKYGLGSIKGTRQLNEVENLINQQGIKDFAYPKQMIDQAKRYLPKDEATKEMIRQVQAGNYKPAFSMRSQLGEHERNLYKGTASEKLTAPVVGDLRKNMLNHLDQVLRSKGMHEEADLLRQGTNNYRRYKQVMNKVIPIAKYIGIPTSAIALGDYAYNLTKKGFSD